MQVSNLKDKLKEVEDNCILTRFENFNLQEKVHSLKEKLKDANFELQKANTYHKESLEHRHISELSEMKNSLMDSESKTLPEQANEMNMEKMSLLEKQLRKLDIQL
ncbi:hypothetical protein GIB67_022413 [Kingdonia uniflora]|uniref:Uncharacterized protein n=1 Tax=Kingdonia uniflora TaxID=39325 RepID=A0A7J7MTY3_9MAGN|nr:hypothetical protein GIB67_022413 [Kingdonia uniflora]